MVFPFQFVNMMYHIDLLPYIEESLHPWDVLSCSVISNSLWPHRLYPPDSSVHGDSPGKITGMDLPGDLPNSGIEPRTPALQADSLPSELPGKPLMLNSILLCDLLINSPLDEQMSHFYGFWLWWTEFVNSCTRLLVDKCFYCSLVYN